MLGARIRLPALASALVIAAATACGPSAPATPTPAPTAPSASAAGTPAPSGALSGKLTIAGSSALQPLVDQAAKSFQAANKNVQITVSAGGSGAGRTGACQGSLDIGMSDVPLTDE